MTLTLNPAILRLKYSLSSRESCRSTCTCACALSYFAVRCEVEAKRIERLVEVSANESLLCCVKVYCDWMRVNPHIIATCAKVCFSAVCVMWISHTHKLLVFHRITYHYSILLWLLLGWPLHKESLKLRRFKSDRNEIWQDCSFIKCTSIDGVVFSVWRHSFKMTAMMSFHAKKCCHLGSTNTASAGALSICRLLHMKHRPSAAC